MEPIPRILQVADEVHPGTSVKAGGADKLQLVMDRMKEESYR